MGGGLKRQSLKLGFTIAELLIVIIVIAILATLVVMAYNGVQKKAADTQHSADLAQLDKSIRLAREITDKTLLQVTISGCTFCSCYSIVNNPDGIEPRQLPQSNPCWIAYKLSIDRIATASGTNLERLKVGDVRGNPYYIDENEGEGSLTNCTRDSIGYMTGNGTSTAGRRYIPLYSAPCT